MLAPLLFDSLTSQNATKAEAEVSALEGFMQRNRIGLLALAFLFMQGAAWQARAQAEKPAYQVMAPVEQYLMADKNSEIALARSAAPAAISDGAEVQVLGRGGYTVAVAGKNGFVCLVERAFAASTDFPQFWNPRIKGPDCVNAAAARTYLPALLLKAKLALAGRSKAQIAAAIQSAREKKELPAIEPGAMGYMLSKQQYLNDDAIHWHPHLMIFVPGDAGKSWGADLENSPVMSANDPEERMTTLFIVVATWSDGTPAPHDMH